MACEYLNPAPASVHQLLCWHPNVRCPQKENPDVVCNKENCCDCLKALGRCPDEIKVGDNVSCLVKQISDNYIWVELEGKVIQQWWGSDKKISSAKDDTECWLCSGTKKLMKRPMDHAIFPKYTWVRFENSVDDKPSERWVEHPCPICSENFIGKSFGLGDSDE